MRILALLLCLVLSSPVVANHLCSTHGAMVEQLKNKYNEQSIGAGQDWEIIEPRIKGKKT